MISVMVSKWVADAFGKDGIYSIWIAMHQYPWLPARDFRDKGQTAAHVMKSAGSLVVISEDGQGCTVRELDGLVRRHSFRGFPVVYGEQLLGIVMRDKLRACIGGRWRMFFPDRDGCADDDEQRGCLRRTAPWIAGARSCRPVGLTRAVAR